MIRFGSECIADVFVRCFFLITGSQKSTSSDSSDLTSHPGEKLFTKDTAVTRVSLQHIDQSGNSKSIKSANSDTASSDTTSTNSQLSQQSGKKVVLKVED